MAAHDLKILPEYFEAVLSGVKTFEIRFNDRNYAVGDILVLREFDSYSGQYTGRKVRKTISFLLDDFRFLKNGYVCLALSNSGVSQK